MKSTFLIFAVFVMLMAAATRLPLLDAYPPGVSVDEAINVIDAHHIALTGNFPMYEEGNGRVEPLYRIFLAAGAALGGASVWSMRLVSALMNLVTIAAVGWLTRESLMDLSARVRNIGMVTAMVAITVMIGHMTLSRSIYRAHPQLLFVVIGAALTLQALRTRRWRDFIIAGIGSGLVIYTYTAGWVFPFSFVVLALALLLFHRDGWRQWLPGMALVAVSAVVVISPVLYLVVTSPGAVFGRAEELAQTSPALLDQIQAAMRQIYDLGDQNPQYNAARRPILSDLWLPLFITGLLALVMRLRTRSALFIGSMLVLFNIPMLAANEIPHGLRSAALYPVIAVIIGTGTAFVLALTERFVPRLRKNTLLPSLGLLVLGIITLHASVRNWETYTAYFDNAPDWRQWSIHGYDLDHNEWFFRTDHRDFADWIARQQQPLLIPQRAIGENTTRAWLVDDYPRVDTADGHYQPPPDMQLVLPWRLGDNDYVTDTRDFALLHNNTITLLPPLSDATHNDLMALRSDATSITRDGRILTELAEVMQVPASVSLDYAPVVSESNTSAPLAQVADDELHLIRWYGKDTYNHANPPRELPVTLVWSPQRRIGHEYASFVQLQTQDYQRISGTEHLIHRWLYPSTIWNTDDTVPDTHTLPLPETLDAGAYRVSTGIYFDTYAPQPIQGIIPTDLTDIATIGWYKVPQRETVTIPDDAPRVEVQFGDTFTLLNAQISQTDAGQWQVALYWQSETPRPPIDATIFVHFFDEENTIIAQNDSRPWQGQYPTFIWDEGEVVKTTHSIAWDGDSLDDVRLRVGMYTFPGPQNLPVQDGDTTYADGLLSLGSAADFVRSR